MVSVFNLSGLLLLLLLPWLLFSTWMEEAQQQSLKIEIDHSSPFCSSCSFSSSPPIVSAIFLLLLLLLLGVSEGGKFVPEHDPNRQNHLLLQTCMQFLFLVGYEGVMWVPKSSSSRYFLLVFS